MKAFSIATAMRVRILGMKNVKSIQAFSIAIVLR
jgi:hypothetical protein